MENEELMIVDAGASGAGGAGDAGASGAGAEDELLILDDTSEEPATGTEKTETADEGANGAEKKPAASQDDKDSADYASLVSGRIRGLVKKSPALGEALKASPEVQGVIEGIFRREAAFRDIFPTLAEAKELRERLPNGVQDLNTLVEETKELQTIDSNFYERGSDGNFPGHEKMIKSFYETDKDASIALFKQIPKTWASLDRESYNEVMGKIVGATFQGREIPEFLSGLLEMAEGVEGSEDVVKGLKRLQNFVLSYTMEKKKTPQDEQLERERADRARENSERSKTDQQAFHRTFVSNSLQLQKDIISKHPVMVKLAALKSLPADKKTELQEKIRKSIELFLGQSPAFMKKIKAAYANRNAEEIGKIQRAAWSQSWLLNRMIRTVLRKETPQLISNRDTTTRRASASPQKKSPDNTGDKNARKTRPYQQSGQWYWPSGARMSSEDVLKGKHEAA